MKIEDYEEAEGLTMGAVSDWLRAYGWTLGPATQQADGYLPPGQFWDKGSVSLWNGSIISQFDVIAEAEGRSVQSLLREISPRWVKGIPSADLRAAWPGAWIGRSLGANGRYNVMIGQWTGDEFHAANKYAIHVEDWSFWPVNNHGDRVPLPTVARSGDLPAGTP